MRLQYRRLRALSALLDRLFKVRRARAAPPVKPGVYPYTLERDGQFVRLHLRADASGDGVLVANAALGARLSKAGVYLAKRLLDGASPDTIVGDVPKHFRHADPVAVRADIAHLQSLFDSAAAHRHAYPLVQLESATLQTQDRSTLKPIAADVPFAPRAVLEPLLRRLWDEAIPHVILTLPEAFDHAAACSLVELAEDLGMIAGVRGTGLALNSGSLLEDLAQAGVDHVNVAYLSADAEVHDRLLGAGDHAAAEQALARALDSEVCPVAELALLEETLPSIDTTLARLVESSVQDVAFLALVTPTHPDTDRHGALSPAEVLQSATGVEESVEHYALSGSWYAPVLRDARVSIVQQLRFGPRSSGDTSVRVLPDGEVILSRGPWRVAGNVMQQAWSEIQAGPAYTRYLAQLAESTRCAACNGASICALHCPLSPAGWADNRGAMT